MARTRKKTTPKKTTPKKAAPQARHPHEGFADELDTIVEGMRRPHDGAKLKAGEKWEGPATPAEK